MRRWSSYRKLVYVRSNAVSFPRFLSFFFVKGAGGAVDSLRYGRKRITVMMAINFRAAFMNTWR